MIQGKAGCMKQLKLWMFLSDLLWELIHLKDKCCVSRAYAVCVCWVTLNFWESAFMAEKKFKFSYLVSR